MMRFDDVTSRSMISRNCIDLRATGGAPASAFACLLRYVAAPRMAASGLRSSCAMLAASCPIAASLSARSIASRERASPSATAALCAAPVSCASSSRSGTRAS